jgi:hypothetical protein
MILGRKLAPWVVAAGLLACVTTAQGAFLVSIQDPNPGGGLVVIADNGAGDTDLTVGLIVTAAISPSVTSPWTITLAAAISKPVIGGPNSAELHLNGVAVSSGAGLLYIDASDTGYTLPGPPPGVGTLTSAIGGTTAGSVFYQEILDPDDLNFYDLVLPADGDETVNTIGPLGPGAFAGTDTGLFVNDGTSFSLSELVDILHGGAGVTSFDADSIAVVPAPSALLLVGIGLGAFAWLRRRLV